MLVIETLIKVLALEWTEAERENWGVLAGLAGPAMFSGSKEARGDAECASLGVILADPLCEMLALAEAISTQLGEGALVPLEEDEGASRLGEFTIVILVEELTETPKIEILDDTERFRVLVDALGEEVLVKLRLGGKVTV